MNKLTDCFTLRNGVKIPCVGFGTFKTPSGEVCEKSVKAALRCGYRHIDTAAAYHNEASVGKAIRESGIPREEIFVTSKLFNPDQGYASTLEACDISLKLMGLDYLDLYLIHWPIPQPKHAQDWQELNHETWRAFEELYRAGKLRAIGLSNYLQHHIETIVKEATVLPMVDQLEIHPGYGQAETVAYCQQNDILPESWGPLCQGKAFGHPVLEALAAKYGCSVSQLCIRWSLQQGVLPLPKSVHEERIAQNAQVFGFEISQEDMQKMAQVEGIGRCGRHPDSIQDMIDLFGDNPWPNWTQERRALLAAQAAQG